MMNLGAKFSGAPQPPGVPDEVLPELFEPADFSPRLHHHFKMADDHFLFLLQGWFPGLKSIQQSQSLAKDPGISQSPPPDHPSRALGLSEEINDGLGGGQIAIADNRDPKMVFGPGDDFPVCFPTIALRTRSPVDRYGVNPALLSHLGRF